MYRVTITESPVCIAHKLSLPYESKCNNLHGHNYTVEVIIRSAVLNAHSMVVDFSFIKAAIRKYDHSFLGADWEGRPDGEHWPVEPSTAEKFADAIYHDLIRVLHTHNEYAAVESVSVWETPNNKVTVTYARA